MGKADPGTALYDSAVRTQQAYRAALHLVSPEGRGPCRLDGWVPPVLLASAKDKEGIAAVWETIQSYFAKMDECGMLAQRRGLQKRRHFITTLQYALMQELSRRPFTKTLLKQLSDKIATEALPPRVGVQTFLEKILPQ
eukprot:NODE_2716_length_551_cov_113.822709_g2334_i0.p2 GENE.NODE_2716_length_551_cov_113.822709_g2334_i0~~NODE_2716_length_551_cov_113.822709_g2334_i0.p2  ORF type:complete len:147 (-),score=50.46 NODE_2716_length_551_cov_113.822709_g2334_i0:110-526(-)